MMYGIATLLIDYAVSIDVWVACAAVKNELTVRKMWQEQKNK